MAKKKQERRDLGSTNSAAVVKLRAILVDSESTGASIARELGCTRSNLSCLLNGKSLPGLRMAVAIEKLYGIAPSDWLA